MTERWKIIPSFPDYEASNLGKIRRSGRATGARTGRNMKLTTNKGGYAQARLRCKRKKKWVLVHRAVAEAWLGSIQGRVVHHQNRARHDNRVINLQIVSAPQNNAHTLNPDWDYEDHRLG